MLDVPRRAPFGWVGPIRVLLSLLAVPLTLALFLSLPSARRTRPSAVDLVVDPNTVPTEVLGALPRIGPVLAGRIAEERLRGPFRSLDDLDARVRGIGPATIEALRPHLRIEPRN